jgi:hypothetical protein
MSNVIGMRAAAALFLAVLLPVVAGCGSDKAVGSSASVVPADVAAYVSVDTSFEGDKWRAVTDLLANFPDGEGALEELLDEAAEKAGLDAGTDVRDALGPEVALAVLAGPSAGKEPPVVLLTQPDDEEAWNQLFDGDEARAEVGGWQVVAEDEDVLDRYREALEAGSLEESQAFAEAMGDLPGDALASLYANSDAFAAALPTAPGALPQLPFGAGGGLDASVGAVLRAEDDGVRVEGQVLPGDESLAPVPEAYESELVEMVPAGSVAFLSFDDLGAALTESGGMLGGGQSAFLPFDPEQLGALLSGETAVYVRPGPAVTVLTQVEDEAAALRTVEALVGLMGKQAHLAYGAFDGVLAVSSSKAELDALRGEGPRLAEDQDFQDALAQAGLPAETTGFGYVDVQGVAPLLLGLAGPKSGTAEVPTEYLEPLGGAVFWGAPGSGDVQSFTLFLGID